MLRLLKWIVFLVLATLVAGYALLRGSLPAYDGDATLGGLAAPVTIERDALGVATVTASSRLDAFRALGFVHGQERFFEMDLMRRMAAGELAELFGAAALPTDKDHRVHRMRARAAAVLDRATPTQRERLQAYVAGVNAGLASLKTRPFAYLLVRSTPRAWSEADCILVLDAMFFDLVDTSGTRELKLGRMRDALPPSLYALLTSHGSSWDAPIAGPALELPPLPTADEVDLRTVDAKALHSMSEVGGDIAPGSNSFAVDGTLTTHGAALVANDMHLGLRVPNIWFRARVRFKSEDGRDVDLAGATLPGVPALVAGSNRHIAWAFTNSYGDYVDWVKVHWLDEKHTRYRTVGGEAPLEVHDETIAVAGGQPETLRVRETTWGPIIAPDDPKSAEALALAWTAHRAEAVNLELTRLEDAADVAGALAVAQRSGIPPQNFVVGDEKGHIAWTVIGQIPIRSGYDASVPADWLQPGVGWNGWLAPDDHPMLIDPPRHRLWTANTRVGDAEAVAKLGDGGYVLGARATQIRDDLLAKERFGPADLLAIQTDDRAVFLERWWKLLRATLEKSRDPALAELDRLTKAWDERASPEAHAYRLVRAFRLYAQAAVIDMLVAPMREKDPAFVPPPHWQAEGVVWKLIEERPPHLLVKQYADWDALLVAAAHRVVADLGSQPGGLAARSWGERNTSRIRHPISRALPHLLGRFLDMPAHELAGDGNMPRVQAPDFGASERFAVSPGHEDEAYFHMPGGQSGHPLSPYYGSGHGDWEQGKATPFLPGPAQKTLTLRPAG